MIITEKVRGLRRKNKQGILSCWQNTHAGYSQNSKLKKMWLVKQMYFLTCQERKNMALTINKAGRKESSLINPMATFSVTPRTG